jgi:hypothetical protein
VVVLATLAFAMSLAAWAVVSPGYRTPDEWTHTSTVLRLAFDGTYPDPGVARLDPVVPATYDLLGLPDPYEATPLAPRSAMDDDPSLLELRRSAPRTDAPDQMTQHPPLAYLLLAGVVEAFDLTSRDPATALLALRLCAALLLLPLPVLMFAAARRLGVDSAPAALAAWLPVGWPQLGHVGASVSNGSLLVLLCSVATLGLIRLATGDLSVRTAAWTGAAIAGALLTKGLALALGPAAVVAIVVAVRSAGVMRAFRPAAVLAGFSLVGLAWWVANVVRFGTVQPSGFTPADMAEAFLDRGLSAQRWVMTYLDGVSATSWFNPLEFEITPPTVMHRGVTLIVAGATLVAAIVASRRQLSLSGLLVAVLPALGASVITAYGSYEIWSEYGAVAGARGRYLQIAAVGLGVVTAVLIQRLGRAGSAAPLLAGVVSVGALVVTLEHWWVGDNLLDSSATLATWWPVGAWWVPTCLALVVISALACTVLAARADHLDARRPSSTAASPSAAR